MKKLTFTLLAFLFGVTSFAQLEYGFTRIITIPETGVEGTTDYTDFVVFLNITDDDLRSIDNGGNVQNTGGYDIQFGETNCNGFFDHQLESYDPVTGELNVWIKIPNLGATEDTEFRMYYGNSGVLADLSTKETWSNGFESVWHYNDNPAEGTIVDFASTADGEAFGMDALNSVDGKLGTAINFDGTDDYIALNSSYETGDAIAEITLSAWVNSTFSGTGIFHDNWALLDFDRSEYYSFFITPDGRAVFSISGSAEEVEDFFVGDVNELNDGIWHQIVAVYDGTDILMYIDGILRGTSPNAIDGFPISSDIDRFGISGDGSEASIFNGVRNLDYYDGNIDELRIAEVVRNADWILTEYNNQNDPSSFFTIAAQEEIVRIDGGMDFSICTGDSVTLSGSGSVDDVYTWSDGVVNGEPFVLTTTTTYQVNGINELNCNDSSVVTIVVNDLPEVVANVDETEICFGEVITLSGSGAETYEWNLTEIMDGIPYGPTEAGLLTFIVAGTDINGCIGIDSIDIDVLAAPSIDAFADNTTICIGDELTLTSAGDPGTVIWNDGIMEGVPFITDEVGTFVYTVMLTAGPGCMGIDSVEVTVNDLPVIEATVSDSTACIGQEIIFSGLGGLSYEWDNDIEDGVAFGVTTLGSTIYTVIGTDGNGCQGEDSVEVIVTETDLMIDWTSTDEIFGSDGTIDLTISGGTPDYLFDWNTDEASDFDDPEDLTDLVTGTYEVIVRDAEGCQVSESIEVSSQVGIEEDIQETITIAPNPASQFFNINGLSTEKVVEIEVLSINGQVVLKESATTTTIDISKFFSGVYFVKVTFNDGNIATKKLIVK